MVAATAAFRGDFACNLMLLISRVPSAVRASVKSLARTLIFVSYGKLAVELYLRSDATTSCCLDDGAGSTDPYLFAATAASLGICPLLCWVGLLSRFLLRLFLTDCDFLTRFGVAAKLLGRGETTLLMLVLPGWSGRFGDEFI